MPTTRCWPAATALTRTSTTSPTMQPGGEVARLRCLRGIDTLSAIGLAAETRGLGRFDQPMHVSAFLGIVPSEHSSGERRRVGSITKAGSRHGRRLLVEAAWHYRKPPAWATGCAPVRPAPTRPPSTAPGAPNDACTSAGATCTRSAASAPPSPTSPSPASWRTSAGDHPTLNPTDNPAGLSGRPPRRATMADDCTVSTPSAGRARSSDGRPATNNGPAVPSPRISVRSVVAQRRPAPRTRPPAHRPRPPRRTRPPRPLDKPTPISVHDQRRADRHEPGEREDVLVAQPDAAVRDRARAAGRAGPCRGSRRSRRPASP